MKSPSHSFLELGAVGDNDPYVRAEREPQVVVSEDIRGIGHGDHDRSIRDLDGKCLIPAGDTLRQLPDYVLVELGATCPTRALYLLDKDFSDMAAILPWLAAARPQVLSALAGAAV